MRDFFTANLVRHINSASVTRNESDRPEIDVHSARQRADATSSVALMLDSITASATARYIEPVSM